MPAELRAIDSHFARFITRGEVYPPWVELVVALTSRALGDGHVCLDLGSVAGRTLTLSGKEAAIPPLDCLADTLSRCRFVGGPDDYLPLVLDRNRLYLHRYHRYEEDVATAILARGRECVPVDETALREGMARIFPGPDHDGTDWQKVAAVAAVSRKLVVISGGPGTGKTSTVVRVLALLIEQAGEAPLRIALAAPTGKAAARLKESIAARKAELACDETVRQRIPERVHTIHSLLGARSGSIHFRYHAENPLPYDVVIVDEASMVALPLMARLCRALPGGSRLILLGDRDQLASVEAGSVLGDIGGNGREGRFSEDFAALVERTAGERLTNGGETVGPLEDSLVILSRTYRFGAGSGIGRLAAAQWRGEGEAALELCSAPDVTDISWNGLPGVEEMRPALADEVVSGYGPFLAATDPLEALGRLERFRLLCVLRQGPFGACGLNALVERILAERGMIDPGRRWYPGRPLMVTVNDHQLKLYNGDVGILLPDHASDGRMRAWFRSPDGDLRAVSPLRLPPHETAWAMTVHKSQGSEFERVLLLLPPGDHELITRELLYTGITRARNSVVLWGDPAGFVAAACRRVQRTSGLEDRLWNGSGS